MSAVDFDFNAAAARADAMGIRTDPDDPGPDDDEAVDRALEERLAFNRAVSTEAEKLRVRDAANRLLRREQEDNVPAPAPMLLPDLLARPRRAVRYRIDQLQPIGGRVLCSSAWKAGKSTLNANLIRSLGDGEPFLGRYDVQLSAGRVTLIDDELDQDMLRDWLDDQDIANPERVAVVSLRGAVGTFDILDPQTRAQWATKLREVDTSYLILDCLRPVLDALGLSEDKDAGRFLVAFDALLAEAGAREGLVSHHMGHNGERSRGDSRLRDWPDAEWRIVREKSEDGKEAADARRYFSAYGRDVDQPEGLLDYDAAKRRLTLTGGSRTETAADELIPDICAYLMENPGASGRALETAMKEAHGHPQKKVRQAIRRGVLLDRIDTGHGDRNATLHFAVDPRSSVPTTHQQASAASAATVRQRTEVECGSASIGDALHSTAEQPPSAATNALAPTEANT